MLTLTRAPPPLFRDSSVYISLNVARVSLKNRGFFSPSGSHVRPGTKHRYRVVANDIWGFFLVLSAQFTMRFDFNPPSFSLFLKWNCHMTLVNTEVLSWEACGCVPASRSLRGRFWPDWQLQQQHPAKEEAAGATPAPVSFSSSLFCLLLFCFRSPRSHLFM